MAQLETALSHCAEVAAWYRLALPMGNTVWQYPAMDQPTMRFDGVKRQTPGFRIHPYEPPVIPKSGEYSVLYYDWEGNLVDTPQDLRTSADLPQGRLPTDYSLFPVEPVLIVNVESGQPWDLRDLGSRQRPPDRIPAMRRTPYEFPLPSLRTQVLEGRIRTARSYRLIPTRGSLNFPSNDYEGLPLHPFVSPSGVPDGEYFIEYYDNAKQGPLQDLPNNPAIAMICRPKPPAAGRR